MTLKILFAGHNIFINGLEQGGKGVLIKFADDTKLGDVANIRQDRDLMQADTGASNYQPDTAQVSCWTGVAKARRTRDRGCGWQAGASRKESATVGTWWGGPMAPTLFSTWLPPRDRPWRREEDNIQMR